MRIAILTFDGCNEIDFFVALNLLNRLKRPGWQAQIVYPSDSVISANGVRVVAQQALRYIVPVGEEEQYIERAHLA